MAHEPPARGRGRGALQAAAELVAAWTRQGRMWQRRRLYRASRAGAEPNAQVTRFFRDRSRVLGQRGRTLPRKNSSWHGHTPKDEVVALVAQHTRVGDSSDAVR